MAESLPPALVALLKANGATDAEIKAMQQGGGQWQSDNAAKLQGIRLVTKYGEMKKGTPWNQRGKFGARVDKTRDAYEFFKGFLKFDETAFRRTQDELFRAGFYGGMDRKQIRWGDKADPTTHQAYIDMLLTTAEVQAAGLKINPTELLRERAMYQSEAELAGPGRAPFSPETADPENFKRVADSVGETLLRRKLTPEEHAQVFAGFNDQYVGAQRAAYDTAESGGASMEAMNPAAFAEKKIKSKFSAEIANEGAASRAQSFYDLLAGSGG